MNEPSLTLIISPDLQDLPLQKAHEKQIGTELHAIIEMINTMQAIDTQGVEPLSHPLDSTARLRCDEVTESPNPTHFQSGAPSTADQYYLVPRVVE